MTGLGLFTAVISRCATACGATFLDLRALASCQKSIILGKILLQNTVTFSLTLEDKLRMRICERKLQAPSSHPYVQGEAQQSFS